MSDCKASLLNALRDKYYGLKGIATLMKHTEAEAYSDSVPDELDIADVGYALEGLLDGTLDLLEKLEKENEP